MSARMLLMSLLLCVPSAVLARDWQVAPDASSLGFAGDFRGQSFNGSFGKFQANIRFNPDQLGQARFDVRVELSSVDTGSADRDDILTGSDFFGVDRWPQARFVTDAFSRDENGKIAATGTLTLRGISKSVVLGIDFEPNADGATLDIETILNRHDFELGRDGDWAGISEQIPVRAHLILRDPQGQTRTR